MRQKPFLLGVTGGLGSGKSTVCGMLAGMGCAVFEADRAARELQVSDPRIVAGIRTLFGDGVYSTDRSGRLSLDRRAVARRIFSDDTLRERLNRLVHPGVFEAFRDAIRLATGEGARVLVKEAAILFESGGELGLDAVAVVVADSEKRVERAVGKGMGTREEVLRRMAAQWPQEKLVEKADFVLENNGTLGELEERTRRMYEVLLERADA